MAYASLLVLYLLLLACCGLSARSMHTLHTLCTLRTLHDTHRTLLFHLSRLSRTSQQTSWLQSLELVAVESRSCRPSSLTWLSYLPSLGLPHYPCLRTPHDTPRARFDPLDPWQAERLPPTLASAAAKQSGSPRFIPALQGHRITCHKSALRSSPLCIGHGRGAFSRRRPSCQHWRSSAPLGRS